MKNLSLPAFVAAILITPSVALSDTYTLDPSHSQIVFSYNHFGFSTSYGMFSGFAGEIDFDATNPAASSVKVSMPEASMYTGWEARLAHFMSGDFFGANDQDLITFQSTSIELTGEKTALISGDLTMNGVTKPITLDTVMNKAGAHPLAGNGRRRATI